MFSLLTTWLSHNKLFLKPLLPPLIPFFLITVLRVGNTRTGSVQLVIQFRTKRSQFQAWLTLERVITQCLPSYNRPTHGTPFMQAAWPWKTSEKRSLVCWLLMMMMMVHCLRFYAVVLDLNCLFVGHCLGFFPADVCEKGYMWMCVCGRVLHWKSVKCGFKRSLKV